LAVYAALLGVALLDKQLTCIYRGPEIETWLGVEEGTDPAVENDWSNLPFMSLTDGAHAYVPSPHPRHRITSAPIANTFLYGHG
jgi:hypothetical protein